MLYINKFNEFFFRSVISFFTSFIIVVGVQGQVTSQSHIYSEAPFVVENGVKMSPQLTVHFKERVFDLPAGTITTSRNEMESIFTNLNTYFSNLEKKYGSITFIKQIPSAVWGNVWHRNKRTGTMVQLHDMSQLFTMHFSGFVPIDSIIQKLEQMEEVLYAHQPIQAVSLNDPNDPNFNATEQWNLFKIDAPQAWDITTGSSNIIIGIIEIAGGFSGSGVPDRDHIDFILPNGDSKFVPNLGNFGSPAIHPTQVAGIVGAATNDGEGIASLGWNIRMIPYRFYDYDPNPNGQNGLVNRIRTAADTCDVINCSFVTVDATSGTEGCPPTSPMDNKCVVYGSEDYASVGIEIHNALEAGVVVVAGTGNTGWEITSQHDDCIECLPISYTPWPAAYSGVIGVSATNANDEFGENPLGIPYNHGTFVDVAAPGIDILTTNINNNYSVVRGTSFSSPHVAALAGLLLSIKELTPTEVRETIQTTAEDLGDSGWDQYFGYGRINALQAVLETEQGVWYNAYQNKSLISNATYSNSARHLTEGAEYLHEVFTSDGEIFYRRSDDGGSSWDVTKRISPANGQNKNACLTYWGDDTDGTLHVVWERQVSGDLYEVWYSKSNAQEINWSEPVILPGGVVTISSLQSGTMPVISFIQEVAQLVVVFCSEAGLFYRLSWDYGDSWVTPSQDRIVSYHGVRYPSLSRNASFLSLVYDKRPDWYGVYSRIFNGSSWSNESKVAYGTGTMYNRTASVTVDVEGNPLCAWRGQQNPGSAYSIVFRKGDSDNTWDEWFVEFETTSGVTQYSPSITSTSRDEIPTTIGIINSTTEDEIQLKTYDYFLEIWNEQNLTDDGNWPNMAEYFGTSDRINYMWTNQNGPPYLVELYDSWSSQLTMPQQATARSITNNLVHRRRAVITEQVSGSQMIIAVDPLTIQDKSFKEKTLPFKNHSMRDSLDVKYSNFSRYLGNTPDTLNTNVNNLSFSYKLSFPSLVDSTGVVYTSKFNGKFSIFLIVKDVNNPKQITKINVTNTPAVLLNVANLAGKAVEISPEIRFSDLDTAKLSFSVGDVYSPVVEIVPEQPRAFQADIKTSDSEPIPKSLSLSQNYPNPFNPETVIKFGIPTDQQISLKIYSTLGEEVKVLANGHFQQGFHEIIWNGKNDLGKDVSSGVYFYSLKAGNQLLVN
jgi:hypothetical protein